MTARVLASAKEASRTAAPVGALVRSPDGLDGTAILQSGLAHLLTSEKKRGVLTSIINGCFITSLNYVGVMILGLSAPMSTFLFMYVVGSVSGYSLDIMFAKHRFPDGNGGAQEVPYHDFGRRFRWLLWSLPNAPFFKFLVALIIETLTGISILRAVIIEMDQRRVFASHARLRNLIAAVVVTCTVFLLFGNILRFDWAYANAENPLMNISVLMSMALSLLVFSLAYTTIHEINISAAGAGGAKDVVEKEKEVYAGAAAEVAPPPAGAAPDAARYAETTAA